MSNDRTRMTDERLAELRRGIQAHDANEIGYECKAWEHACELLREVIDLRAELTRSRAADSEAVGRPELCDACSAGMPGMCSSKCALRTAAWDAGFAAGSALVGDPWRMRDEIKRLKAKLGTVRETHECQPEGCTTCAALDCPSDEPLHYHHDGCPACSADPGGAPKTEEREGE